jgi:hypothetical protein
VFDRGPVRGRMMRKAHRPEFPRKQPCPAFDRQTQRVAVRENENEIEVKSR